MAQLERMLYRSEATGGGTGSLLSMATLLAEAQRNNDRHGLTGALAAHEGQFVQVLEGPADRLDRLLERLESDPRHRDLRVLERVPIEQRSFGDWTMAHARITPDLKPILDRVAEGGAPERLIRTLKEAASAA